LEKKETRLRAMRSNVDPAQIRELEASREMLKFWQKQLKSMAWNVENEYGIDVKALLPIEPIPSQPCTSTRRIRR
jgi:hypothetical protein